MKAWAQIIGVHPVDAEVPVHLIEVLVEGNLDDFDVGDVTQEDPSQPKMNWQVAYDERFLEKAQDKARSAFFFHYLDLEKPLLTSIGPLTLPEPTKVPQYLKEIEYEPP